MSYFETAVKYALMQQKGKRLEKSGYQLSGFKQASHDKNAEAFDNALMAIKYGNISAHDTNAVVNIAYLNTTFVITYGYVPKMSNISLSVNGNSYKHKPSLKQKIQDKFTSEKSVVTINVDGKDHEITNQEMCKKLELALFQRMRFQKTI